MKSTQQTSNGQLKKVKKQYMMFDEKAESRKSTYRSSYPMDKIMNNMGTAGFKFKKSDKSSHLRSSFEKQSEDEAATAASPNKQNKLNKSYDEKFVHSANQDGWNNNKLKSISNYER